MTKKFDATFESLYQYECPEWFRDAKFGIWSHWGPQSVPMYGDWYARNMYIEGSPQYLYHLRHYGHPSKFGYKDLVKLWKAENFDPEGLMDLYYKAGARYFMGQAMHHDHFYNYPSRINRFNSAEMGPMRDICGEWQRAAQKYNLPFGLSEHLGASFSWWRTNKLADKEGPYAGVPYDGNDPEYRDFYYDNYEHLENERDGLDPWYTQNPAFQQYWLDSIREVVDLYHPDLLYSDGGVPFAVSEFSRADHADQANSAAYQKGLELIAYYYNEMVKLHGKQDCVYLQKDPRPEIYRVGTLDIERSQLPSINPDPWHTDTCIGGWFYDVRQQYKSTLFVLETLVDIVSKNGNMLLNILQRPDGTLDDEALFLLKELGEWFSICGEGIYGTRPWRTFGEGETRAVIKKLTEEQITWGESDYRYTAKGNNVYAFMMHAPESRRAVLRSFDERVKAVELLGFGKVDFEQPFGVLNVRLPEKLPTHLINCLKITL